MQITLKTLQQQTFKIVVTSDELVRPSRKFIPCERVNCNLPCHCSVESVCSDSSAGSGTATVFVLVVALRLSEYWPPIIVRLDLSFAFDTHRHLQYNLNRDII